jgi:hypothetical protein
VDIVAIDDSKLDTVISTPTQSYEVEFNRKDPLVIRAGASVRAFGLHWFADVGVVGEEYVRLGTALVFF